MNKSRDPKCTCGTGVPPVSPPAGRRCHRWLVLGPLRISLTKRLITGIAPAAMLMISGCDTMADNGVFAIIDTSVSFIRDFLLNVLAAVLL